ncbi:LOW QUALITY PROTEIN: inactive tyrosine-protein kinase 7a [Pygocentrus nattereri]|uniref:LOW QUALITY PROTEIN: inactive tyrosine-protein kinase 7a n=1 Tax=Pygocentrus nattereri TaxID=42514 RepID=UPI001891E378|nr:LOW QUALITY PROTEIN: inactive tyrosine-protein kinase 7a [Pygocentrus nattereri]
MSSSAVKKARRSESSVKSAPLGTWTATVFMVVALLCKVLCVLSASFHFTKEPKSQDALHGRSAMLRCEVSDPEGVAYRWLLNGQSVSSSERRFQEAGNLKFSAIDRTLDAGNFQCVATKNITGEEERTSEASFNIKWLESGEVTLQSPASEAEIKSSLSVTLRCDIDGHPRPTIRWYRDGVLLAEKNRKINNKERTLMFPSTSPDDNGFYYCCAKNAAGQVCSSRNFTVTIIDESYPQPVVKPEDLVVLKNEEAHFHCQFTAEPQPTVEWYHENELISNKTRVFLLNNGSLFISKVTQRNTGRYRCVAQGPHGPPVTLEAFLRLAEIDDMLMHQSRVFTADSLERVSCRPPRGHPEPEVWWEQEGQRVPAEGRVYQDGLDLVFSPTRGEDSGTYVCFAQNKAGQRKQELMVTVATAPEWIEMPKDSQLEEGHAGYLHCHTRATPDPEVTWYRASQSISGEDVRFKQFPNGTLRINNVEVYDGQKYHCESKNEAGSINAHAKVIILERLKFTPTPQSLQCLELDKEGNLQCSAKGRLPPTIRWSKADGREIPARVKQNGGVLRFSKVTRADAGNYTCLASNSLQGEIRAVVQLTVAVYVVFKLKPENTTVYQGHTAILHCQATGDPSPIIQWKKKDKFLEAGKSRFQMMPNGSLIVHDVIMEDTGSYTCIAGNSCNIAHTSAELYVVEKPVQHSMSDDEKAPYKMIQTIGLSVGAAVAYIIVVLGLMFYCKQRRKAKRLQKSRDEPEMECLNGGAVQQNGQTTAEIQEEVALTNITATGNNKRHSTNDKLCFPRANLHPITTLGKGEFGEVFLAKVKTGEDEKETVVLVKGLQTRDEQLQMDFRRESEMFAKLGHLNITRLLGMCRETEPYYMILEYADMGDLKQYLKISKSKDEKGKNRPLGTKQKVSLCLQVAWGMEHLSNQRFVHKDLAARNCLISAKRQVKVSSLGLSKDVYSSEYYNYRQAWIPLRWLPSESVFEDDFSTKTDVWSFGVLMWEVFSFGELPHAELPDDKVLEGLQEAKLKLSPPQGCPSRVYKLMLRCWAASPKDRASFSDIVTALSELPSESKV